MGAAFFDLDRTLVDTNSGGLWVRAEWRAGRLDAWDVVRAAWWLGRYHLGYADGLDAVLRHAAARLAGTDEAVLAARVEAWFAAEVAGRLRPGAVAALARHRAAGDRLVVATTSTQFVARAACAAFGLDVVLATTLEVVDGRLTGRIADAALGDGKAAQASRWAAAAGIPMADCTCYTDSFTDMGLLSAVGRPVVIAPDRRLAAEARRRGWPVEDWGSARPAAAPRWP